MGWHKTDSQTTRRNNALKAHKGDLLATGRALMRLANITTDRETERKARQDAQYFFARYRRIGRNGNNKSGRR